MTAATTKTNPADLPHHKGQPVPWVTRWTGEVNSDKLSVSMHPVTKDVHLRYEDGNETRDDYGMLWKREGVVRRGEPQYSQLNTYRQRASMNKRLCQVCGSKIDERPIRWLLGRDQLHDTEGGPVTISPPTCSGCIPLALELCPHLKKAGYAIIKVLDYERWGVMGEAIAVEPMTGKVHDMRGAFVPYVDSPIAHTSVVGYQQAVQFTKFVFEKGFDE